MRSVLKRLSLPPIHLHYPGIGLAITRHLLQNTSLRIVATTSQKSHDAVRESALSGLDLKNGDGRLTTLPLDVTDEASIASARDEIKEKMGRNMRLLVNVSGVVRPLPYLLFPSLLLEI